MAFNFANVKIENNLGLGGIFFYGKYPDIENLVTLSLPFI
jgi:hypothetical protein